MVSRSSSRLRGELWMYKSDSDGFFSSTVVTSVYIDLIDYSDTCYSSIVKLTYMHGSRGCGHKTLDGAWRYLPLISVAILPFLTNSRCAQCK